MRKRRRTCTHIYLGSNDKRFEYVTDGNVKLADSVTIERWVVRLMACTKAWMRLDADGMRTINGTRIEGLLNIEPNGWRNSPRPEPSTVKLSA